MVLPFHEELDMFPLFLLFFLPTFALICIQFTLPKHEKHIHVTTMYCRSHDFARDRYANLDVRIRNVWNSVNDVSTTANEIERCSGKKPKGSKRDGIAVSGSDMAR